jgi:hypothetical protein
MGCRADEDAAEEWLKGFKSAVLSSGGHRDTLYIRLSLAWLVLMVIGVVVALFML